MHSHRLTNIQRIKTFVRGGNARFTLVSQRTQARFTYQVRKPDDADVHFVRVLTSSSNEEGYTFLGTIKADGSYSHGMRSKIGQDAPSARAFRYFFDHVANGNLKDLEFWHEGRCGRCGRTLTVPSSIETGFGPDCAEAMGLAAIVREPGTAPAVATSAHIKSLLDQTCPGDDAGAAEWMLGEEALRGDEVYT